MHLIELLKQLDTNIFLSINGLHTSFFDGFMYAVSAKFTWIPLYISVLYILIKQWKKEAVWLILALVLCIVISDQVASGLLKHLVKRLRPSHVDDLRGLVHLVRDYSGGMYGFASSHASNTVGFALLSSLILKQRNYTFAIFSWAIITSYSRIYLGVHYPGDILGGALIGSLAALLCYWVLKRYRSVQLVNNNERTTAEFDKTIPVWVLGAIFFGIIAYSIFVF